MSSENSLQEPSPKRMRSVDGGGADALTTGTGPNETALGDEKLGTTAMESTKPADHGIHKEMKAEVKEEPFEMHGEAWGQMPADLQEFHDGSIKMEMKEELMLSNESVEEEHEVTSDDDESDSQDVSERSTPSRSSSRNSATSSSSSGVSSRPASPENAPRNPSQDNLHEKPSRDRRGPSKCAKCGNHGGDVFRAGHKDCPYWNCNCDLCTHTDNYNQVLRKERIVAKARKEAIKKAKKEQRLKAYLKKDQGVNRNDDSGIGGEDEKVEDDEDEVVHKEDNEDDD